MTQSTTLFTASLGRFLQGSGLEAGLVKRLQSIDPKKPPQPSVIGDTDIDQAITSLYSHRAGLRDGGLVDEAVKAIGQLGDITLARARAFGSGRHQACPISERPLSNPETIEDALQRFTADQLGVDWHSGPPYPSPVAEVDPLLTQDLRGHQDCVVHRTLTDQQLKDARTKVLWALAPHDDYRREIVVTLDGGERRFVQDGYGFYGAMTFVNPPELQIGGYPPSYARAILKGSLPAERGIHFLEPDTLADYEAKLREMRPDLVLLSGIGMNTRALVAMSALANEYGAREVWLGNYAALGPYPILNKAFNRRFFGLDGERYAGQYLTGRPTTRHLPPVEDLISGITVPYRKKGGQIDHQTYQVLHLAIRLGCNRPCAFCAERRHSGGVQHPLPPEEIRAIIDAAYEQGVRHVYFFEPNFGLNWKNKDDPEGVAIRYLASKGMHFSCLSEVKVLKKWGQFMVDHGFRKVFPGLESLAPTHEALTGGRLDALGRPWQQESETVAVVEWLTRHGVDVNGLYMMGNPGETLEAIWAGIERLARLVKTSQISTNIPFPGTDFFIQGVLQGWIHNYDPDVGLHYGYSPWAPGGMVHDPEVIRQMWVRAHLLVNSAERPGGMLDRTPLFMRQTA